MRLSDAVIEAVKASNAIEGIYAEPGDPLFDQHLTAMQLVRGSGPLVSVKEIHSVLMHGLLEDAGQYRDSEAAMVSQKTGEEKSTLPLPEYVEPLMAQFDDMVSVLLRQHQRRKLRLSEVEIADKAFVLHAHGLCIHPFSDGNGRSFRIFWNQIRLRLGLSWLVILPTKPNDDPKGLIPTEANPKDIPSFSYAGEIRKYEDEVFRINFPHVYA